MKVGRTKDYELIRKTQTHPRIYPWIIDDYSPPADQFQPIRDDRIIYLYAQNAYFLGIGMFAPENGVELRTHHFFLPVAWGPLATRAAKLWIQWIWQNTQYQRLTGKTPAFNRLALRFAARLGFEMYGIDRQSIQKDGRLWDQYLFGMSRSGGENHGN